MEYRDEVLGYSFHLPDGWRVDKTVRPLTFFGPRGRVGLAEEHIQVKVGDILLGYREAAAREEFMAEPTALVERGALGAETNVVVCKWHDRTEISAVRDGVHYMILGGQ